MKMFIYTERHRAFCGIERGAPNGPRHEELIVIAENRKEANEAIKRKYIEIEQKNNLGAYDDDEDDQLILFTFFQFVSRKLPPEDKKKIKVYEFPIVNGLIMEISEHCVAEIK
ncbi:MAG: hypothetical protein Q8Q95_04280 [bacterium]|nr:hypothetical protein [bacterium]